MDREIQILRKADGSILTSDDLGEVTTSPMRNMVDVYIKIREGASEYSVKQPVGRYGLEAHPEFAESIILRVAQNYSLPH